MLSVENIIDLPIDIKVLIASLVAPCSTIWTWFAIHDLAFMRYSIHCRHIVVRLFTEYTKTKYYNQQTQSWSLFGKLHRDSCDLPAVIVRSGGCYADITKSWYINGLLHRDAKDPVTNLTLPAICTNGERKEYMRTGYRYREHDLPNVVKGSNLYWMVGETYHRKHGPAVITVTGDEVLHEYYFRNMRHNFNRQLPAVIWFKGGKVIKAEWWRYGVLKKCIDYRKLNL